MNQAPAPVQTLLIVDDTPSNLGMIVGLFEDLGYRVSIAQDGEEGIERARRIVPDLILLDVMMPGIDGFEACRRLKADPLTTDTPVIFMTALADIAHRVNGFKSGGVDYVTKPLHLEEVVARVETHLKLRAAQRQLEIQNAELASHRDNLEKLVAARTAELSTSNAQLQEEIELRRTAEEKIRYSERKFRTLAENAPDCIARYDKQARLVYLNPRLAKELKRPAAEVFGQTMAETLAGTDVSACEHCFTSVLTTGNDAEFELSLPESDGTLRHHDIHLVAEHDEDGRIIGVLAIGRDITERRREQAALAESRDLLRQLSAHRDAAREEERKRIAREIHDELGQILTAQRLDLATLKYQFGETLPALAERCQRLLETADRTIHVVRDISSMLRPAVLDMGLVPALEWLSTEFSKRSGMICRLSMPTSGDLHLDEAYSVALFRITQESLTNVARYAEAHSVNIALSSDGKVWRLVIQDDGQGFDVNAPRPHSFGLVGIRERALMLGGTARFDSRPGLGTTVEIRIPHHQNERPLP